MEQFTNLIELLSYFDTEQKCNDHLALMRWNGSPVCPYCECSASYKLNVKGIGKRWKCKDCRKQYSVRVGTIFEGSKIPLKKWFAAMWIFTSHKKGISSIQLGKDIGVTQKTAWFMLHRLRYGMEHPAYKEPLEGTVEADETFIGGKDSNKHQSKLISREKSKIGYDIALPKTPVLGIVERKGEVRAKVVEDTKTESLQPLIIKNVKQFARVITDEWYAYNQLKDFSFTHSTVKHSLKQYVVGDIHTNTIENFWSQLKRGIYGIYHQCSRKHLQKYIEEFCYRYNTRKMSEVERFDKLLMQSDVGVMHYWHLTGWKFKAKPEK